MKTPDVLLSGNHQKIAEWRGEVVPVSKYAKQCVSKKNNN